MSNHRARRPARRWLVPAVALGVVVILAVVAGVTFFVNRSDDSTVSAGIEHLVPADASQLVITPGVGTNNQWWKTVVAFMPASVQLGNLTPTPALGITHLGYSFSAADPAVALDQQYARMLYIEADTAAHAENIQGWLSSSVGAAAGTVATIVKDRVVVLTASNVVAGSALATDGKGLGSTVAYQADTARREPGALIWEDWGAYVKAAGTSGGKPAEYASFFYSLTGFQEGSRWVGYSASPAAGWTGEFRSGGLNPKLVNGPKVINAIESYTKVLQKDASGAPVVLDGGVGNYLRDSFYVNHPDLKAGQQTMGSKDLTFKPVSAGDTLFSFKPAEWLAGTSATAAAEPEGNSRFAYSINGNRINLKVTVSPAAPVLSGDVAPPTFAPPPGPPPGAISMPVRSGPASSKAGDATTAP